MTKSKELEVKVFEHTGALFFKISMESSVNINVLVGKFIKITLNEIHSEYENKESYLKGDDVKDFGKKMCNPTAKELKPVMVSMDRIPSEVVRSIEYFAKYNELEVPSFVGVCLHRILFNNFKENELFVGVS